MTVRKAAAPDRVKLSGGICKKYFSGMNEAQITDVIAQALGHGFPERG
jgi:hypothetical protein